MTDTEPKTQDRWSLSRVGLVTALVCLAAILGAYLVLRMDEFKANPGSHCARAVVAACVAGFALACLSWPRGTTPTQQLERFSTRRGLAVGMLQCSVAIFLTAVAAAVAFRWSELTIRPAPLLARVFVWTTVLGIALVIGARCQLFDEHNWPAVRRKGRGRYLLLTGILRSGLGFVLLLAGAEVAFGLELNLFTGSAVRAVVMFVLMVVLYGLGIGFFHWGEMEKRHKAGGGVPDHEG